MNIFTFIELNKSDLFFVGLLTQYMKAEIQKDRELLKLEEDQRTRKYALALKEFTHRKCPHCGWISSKQKLYTKIIHYDIYGSHFEVYCKECSFCEVF